MECSTDRRLMLKTISIFLIVLVLSSLACMQSAPSSSSPAPGSPTPETPIKAPSLAANSQPTAKATESAGYCKVIALEALNLRSGAGVSFGVIGWLLPGELLTLTNTPARGAWIEVITETGAKGWINSNYCER